MIFSHYDVGQGASAEMRTFFSGLGDKWVQIATYVGFSPQEISDITTSHPDSLEMQVWTTIMVIN